MEKKPISYQDAGVDIDAGDALVEAIKPALAATKRPGVMGGIGGFGALFDPKACGYNDPLLVSATDGVGTKLLAALECDQLDGIGQDLVAMCVNDLVCQGAEPLFFLDYFATGKLDTAIARRVIASIANACRKAGCALVGGETAEMPRLYDEGHFDLAGFAVGMVERDAVLPKSKNIAAGDAVWGFASSGPHSNGFSLIHKIKERADFKWLDTAPWDETMSVADSLLKPTKLYVSMLKQLQESHADSLKALVHITGGGLPGNMPRVLDEKLAVELEPKLWPRHGFFDWIIDEGLVEKAEAYRAFNMGIGMVAITHPAVTPPMGAIRMGSVLKRKNGGPCQLID